MTTKAATIYEFWNSFEMPAYEENSVPTGEDAPKFPYITYQLVTDSLGNEVAMSASLWYRSPSSRRNPARSAIYCLRPPVYWQS